MRTFQEGLHLCKLSMNLWATIIFTKLKIRLVTITLSEHLNNVLIFLPTFRKCYINLSYSNPMRASQEHSVNVMQILISCNMYHVTKYKIFKKGHRNITICHEFYFLCECDCLIDIHFYHPTIKIIHTI